MSTLSQTRSFNKNCFLLTKKQPENDKGESASDQSRKNEPVVDKSRTVSSIVVASASSSDVPRRNDWIFDDGANDHFCSNFELLTEVTKTRSPVKVATPVNQALKTSTVGYALLPVDSFWLKIKCFYVPEFNYNIVSRYRLCADGFETVFNPRNNCWTISKGDFRLETVMRNGIHMINIPNGDNGNRFTGSVSVVADWHRRLGHLSDDKLKRLSRQVDYINYRPTDFCEVCQVSKVGLPYVRNYSGQSGIWVWCPEFVRSWKS